MGIQALLAVEEMVALVTLQVGLAVMFIRLSMVLAPVWHAPPTMISLVVWAGIVAQMVIPF